MLVTTTPKEKAKELLDKFNERLFGTTEIVNRGDAKECALLAVDEILSELNPSMRDFIPHFGGGGHLTYASNPRYFFWVDVKKELNNL